MSGGEFDYKQYYLDEIAYDIEQEIIDNGSAIPFDLLETWDKREWSADHNDTKCTEEKYNKDPMCRYEYPEDIIKEFKVAHVLLKLAALYTQRIDWLLSWDDGEDSFRERLAKEFEKIDTHLTGAECKDIIEHIKILIK